MMQILSKFDIFGNGIGLNMNCQSTYRTKLGGFLSLAVAISIAAYFWTNFIIFFNQEKLKVSSDREYNVNPSALKIGPDSMMFAIIIYQPNLDFLDNPYFNIELSIGAFENSENKEFIMNYYKIELEPCTEAHFSSFFKEKNVNQDQENNKKVLSTRFLCPKGDIKFYNINYFELSKRLSQEFILRGLYLSPKFDFLRIQVKECVQSELEATNPNWKATCAPKDVVQNFLELNGNFRVSVYHNNYLVSPDKQGQYSEAYLNEDLSFLFIPNQMFKSIDVFFREYNIETTTYGLFTKNSKKETFIVQEYRDFTESTVLGRKDQIYSEIFLRRSPFSQNYYRDHENFTQFLSSLGGFINIVITVIGLIMRKYNYFQFTVDLANKLYNFKLNNSDQKNEEKDILNKNKTNSIDNQIAQMKQETVKFSATKLANSKMINQIHLTNPESPSKASHKSSKVADDTCKVQESPILSFLKVPSYSEISKFSNLNSVKSPKKQFLKINPASFNNLQQKQTNDKINTLSVRQKIWKVIKLINSAGFNYQEYERKKIKSTITSNIRLREQIHNYKQLGYQNKTDFLFDSFKKLIKQQKQKIYFNLSYLFSCFKMNIQSNIVLSKARKSVSQDLDIYTILQKLQEVEKIKRILFSKEQTVLFSFCPKPIINSNTESNKQIEEREKAFSNPVLLEVQNKNNENLFQRNSDFEEIETYQRIQFFLLNYTQKKLYQAFDKLKSKEKKNGLHVLIKELGREVNEIFELSREVVKEHEGIQKQVQLDSDENIMQKKIGNNQLKVSNFKQQQVFNQAEQQQLQSNLNSAFGSHNLIKIQEEAFDLSVRSQKTKLNEDSILKSTQQPNMNLSFFDLDNKSGFIMIDTIPDIPFEPISDNNINKQQFQKETVLKRLE